jgi:hypothetical protein
MPSVPAISSRTLSEPVGQGLEAVSRVQPQRPSAPEHAGHRGGAGGAVARAWPAWGIGGGAVAELVCRAQPGPGLLEQRSLDWRAGVLPSRQQLRGIGLVHAAAGDVDKPRGDGRVGVIPVLEHDGGGRCAERDDWGVLAVNAARPGPGEGSAAAWTACAVRAGAEFGEHRGNGRRRLGRGVQGCQAGTRDGVDVVEFLLQICQFFLLAAGVQQCGDEGVNVPLGVQDLSIRR